jgi:choline dehydrogenase-like flavoprotein
MAQRPGHADVLVIGAGASGAVAALRLLEAGLSVVTLEQGDWPDRDSFRGASPDWEVSVTKAWSALPSVRNGPADYPIDQTRSDIKLVNWNGVGGATVLWNGAWPRMRPADFRVRTEDAVAADWPLTYAELAPFYERVDRQFGASGLAGDPTYPPGAEYPMPPLPLGEGGARVAQAHARLGWHWWPHPCAINSLPYGGRHACVQRGTCGSGCNEGAKASTDLTHWGRYQQAGGRLVTGARVSRITVDRRGLATGAEWLDAGGGLHHQSADLVLCAGNGIGTPRLLLLSAGGASPNGLANASGLVGCGLMLHPTRRVVGYFDDSIDAWQGPSGASVICLQFIGSDRGRGFVRGAKWTLAPTHGPMMLALGGGAWGAAHHAHIRERFGRGLGWNIMAEDLPDDANRVVLAEALVDSSGLPAAKVIYRTDDNSRRMLDFNETQARRSLAEAGARIIDIQPGGVNGHFMGSTRMGDDPARSVVDRWGMAHDVPNLGIVDGGVFVTASAVNPTATIAALALRAAEHLLERRRDLPVPDHAAALAPAAPRRRPPPQPAPAADLSVTPVERERLAVLADALIPAAEDRPCASQAGVAGALLDQMLALRPDLAAPLRRVLQTPVGDPATRLAELAAQAPADRGALLLIVAGGYYLEPGVRRAIGYPGQEARPFNPRDFERFVEAGLLDHLLERTPAV